MKIAFVDDLCHKKTGSTIFLEDILKKQFEVKRFWGNGFKKFDPQELNHINSFKPDIVLFFQRIPNIFVLNKLVCRNILFVPMHDQEIYYSFVERNLINFSLLLTKFLFRFKVLCFSRADYNVYSKWTEALSVQYYPKPKPKCNHYNKVFFWERENGIGLNKAKELVCGLDLIVKTKNVWLSKKEADALYKDCGIAIAPRLSEGIGHGFLELMANGICVIANDEATHNEYIENGYNGILYSGDNPKINLSDWKYLARNAKKSIENGFEDWKNDKEKIINWITYFDKPKDFWCLE